jgi:hypothetical protein
MHEDANGIMIPDSTALQEVHHMFYYHVAETVSELFGDVGPLNIATCLEPIDDDPTINTLLTAANL